MQTQPNDPCSLATTPICASFCDHVSFFTSEAAAGVWLRAHPAGMVLSVEDAHALARGISAQVFGARSGLCR